MKIVLNPNHDFVSKMKQAVEKNDGYCPCSLEQNEDMKCMCRAFREQETPGSCHCGLYIKTKE